jgi:hypothetical protein
MSAVPVSAIIADDRTTTSVQDPVSVMTAGAAILARELSPAGFTFQLTRHGRGSGGNFAMARFTRGDQYLEIHFRYSLGLVTYGWGDSRLSHADYLAGLGKAGAYSGYGTDPLDGFRHVAQDLAGPLSGFRDHDRGGYERSLQAARQPRHRTLPLRTLPRRPPLTSISSSQHTSAFRRGRLVKPCTKRSRGRVEDVATGAITIQAIALSAA